MPVERSTNRCTITSNSSLRSGDALVVFSETLALARTPADLAEPFQTLLDLHGFETATLLTFPRSPLGTRARQPLTHTETRFWLEAASAGFPHRHPVGRLLADAIDPVTWSAGQPLEPVAPNGRQLSRLPAIARRNGVAEAVFVPVHGAPYDVTVVALTTSSPAKRTANTNGTLILAATAMFARRRLLDAQAKRNEIPLTQREAEVTRWIAAGKSDWEIGQILEISAKTVNFHAENVKRKCGVATRVQAIAALYGAMRGEPDNAPPDNAPQA